MSEDHKNLTIGEAYERRAKAKAEYEAIGELLNQPSEFSETPTATASSSSLIGQHCVIRTYSAGVHIGTVEKADGTSVLLKDAVRLYKWTEAFTLSEVATKGVGSASRIAVSVPIIELTQAIEIIPTTDAARKTFEPRNG